MTAHHVRNISAALFAVTLIVSQSAQVQARNHDCVLAPPYHGYIYNGEEIECSAEEDICDAFCDLCWNEPCGYVNYCSDGITTAGACGA